MGLWRSLVLICAILAPGAAEGNAQEQAISGISAGMPQAVPIHAYNEKDQLTGRGWALPLNGAYVTVRSLLANAYRAELRLSDELRAAVTEVGAEDVEGNLMLVSVAPSAVATAGPDDAAASQKAPEFTVSARTSPFPEGAKPDLPSAKVTCGSTSYPLREQRIRDVPVFGLAFTAMTRHRDPIAGCAVLDPEGALNAIVVWDDPFGRPSVLLVPATRAARLNASVRAPWDEWRAGQLPETRLRNSLLSEAMADIWREHYDLAQENLTYLLERNPTDAHGWYYRGYARAMSGKRKLAIIDYENAVHFEPSNADARFSLGFSYALLHRIADAREQVAALEAIDGTLAERLRTLVDSVAESGHDGSPVHDAPAAESATELPPR